VRPGKVRADNLENLQVAVGKCGMTAGERDGLHSASGCGQTDRHQLLDADIAVEVVVDAEPAIVLRSDDIRKADRPPVAGAVVIRDRRVIRQVMLEDRVLRFCPRARGIGGNCGAPVAQVQVVV
jgi:hypothetical protein